MNRTLAVALATVLWVLGASPLQAAEFKTGNITIDAPWTRATPKGAKVAGGFMSITNHGSTADRLVGGSFPGAGRFEVHEMAVVNDVMKMRELVGGLEIGPQQTVVLKPGSYHVMFMDLGVSLKMGDTMHGTLRFEKAGSVDITYEVRKMGAKKHGAMHKMKKGSN